jgi:DNA-binding CsgD family transcriptional regulator
MRVPGCALVRAQQAARWREEFLEKLGAYGLTPREREITALAAQGRSTKQIASALGISPFTVQDHLKAVFGKVGVQSRAELVAALYVRHYEPRRAAGSTPGPYGWYLDDAQTAVG